MSKRKEYEYVLVIKKPITSELEELNKLGSEGWRVVCSPNPNAYLLMRESKD